MKITEATTLAELAAYLTVLGNPFVTIMTTHPDADHARHAVVHLPSVGAFQGRGATEAEALEAAFTELRLKLLPEPLKQFINAKLASIGPLLTAEESETVRRETLDASDEYDRATQARKEERAAKYRQEQLLCHGCQHTAGDHPNDSGCQQWHDESEHDQYDRATGDLGRPVVRVRCRVGSLAPPKCADIAVDGRCPHDGKPCQEGS